jgi:hypothetical protein
VIAALTLMSNPDKVAQSVPVELVHGFFVLTAWVLAVALVVLVIAVLSGPYRWAICSWVKRTGRTIAGARSGDRRGQVVTWMASHAASLRLAGAVVAGILLWIVSVSWLSFLIAGGPVGAVLRAHRRRTVTAAAAAMAAGKLAGLLAATVGAGSLATVFLAALRPGRGAGGPGGHGQQLALPVLARLGGADQPGGDGAACPTGPWRRAARLCWPPAGWPPAGWPGAALGLGSAVPSGIGGLLRGSTGAAVCARRERRGGGHPAVDLG